MTDSIRITASLRIDRPVDEVRAQYRDIDHHIRNDVHPSIRYQWEPAPPGERRIRTTFRILGVPQFDVSRLEDGEGGSFVIRYLEGSNAGMLLVHEFVPLGPGATDVRLSADAPVTLGRKLLGPFFVTGARQVMKKALAEDKRDLEKGSFAPGSAAGNVEGALASLDRLTSKDRAAQRAVLEAACLVSVADRHVDDAERDAIVRLGKVLKAEAETTWWQARFVELEPTASTDRIAGEADRVGAALGSVGAAHGGVTAAAVVGLVSQGMSLGELAVLRRIALAAGIDEASLGAIVDKADAELMAGAAPRH